MFHCDYEVDAEMECLLRVLNISGHFRDSNPWAQVRKSVPRSTAQEAPRFIGVIM